jgi:microcystin-dependent protein
VAWVTPKTWSPGDILTSGDMNIYVRDNTEELFALVLPAGSVVYFAANTPPLRFLKANGAQVSRSTYADLFAVLGTSFGAGDGSTTFNLPDLRGEFLRGWDDGRGVDSGRTFGSAQADAVKNHVHQFNTRDAGTAQAVPLAGGNEGPTRTVTTGNPTAGNAAESRPRNIALLACIKF